MKTITLANDADLRLASDEHIVVMWNPSCGGYQYTCHRTLNAARKQAKKMNGKIQVAGPWTARYEVK